VADDPGERLGVSPPSAIFAKDSEPRKTSSLQSICSSAAEQALEWAQVTLFTVSAIHLCLSAFICGQHCDSIPRSVAHACRGYVTKQEETRGYTVNFQRAPALTKIFTEASCVCGTISRRRSAIRGNPMVS